MRGQKFQSLPDWVKRLSRFDLSLTICTVLLLCISVTYISGIGEQVQGFLADYGSKQLRWIIIGTLACSIIAVIDYNYYGHFWWQIYVFGLLMLVGVLLFGQTINGAKSWIKLGPITLQTAEIAKPCTIVALSWFASQAHRKLSEFWHVIPIIFIGFLPAFLVGLQPDFGSASTFIPITVAVLFVAGIRKRYIIYPILAIAIMTPILYFLLQDHQKKRIDVFVHPISHPLAIARGQKLGEKHELPIKCLERMELMRSPYQYIKELIAIKKLALQKQIEHKEISNILSSKRPDRVLLQAFDKRDIKTEKDTYREKPQVFTTLKQFYLAEGWHARQSLLSIGSGGLKGKGIGNSTQVRLGFLPQTVSTTDSLYAVIAEEGGFAMGTLVILLELGLFISALRIACYAQNTFGKYMAISIAVLFLYHTYINVGMAMGVAPLIGIPLPFISYGGSSIVSAMICIGILQSIYIHRKGIESAEKLKELKD